MLLAVINFRCLLTPRTAVAMADSVRTIHEAIAYEKISDNVFRASSKRSGLKENTTIFGGQYIAQSMMVAAASLPNNFYVHSFHSNFISAGDTRKHLYYKVDKLRDGFSSSARYVTAYQDATGPDKADQLQKHTTVFGAQMSFCVNKTLGESLKHQDAMPSVPSPDECDDMADVFRRVLDEHPELTSGQRRHLESRLRNVPETFDIRPTEEDRCVKLHAHDPTYSVWVKAKDRIEGDDDRLHHYVAAYLSDSTMVSTALLPHAERRHASTGGSLIMSLDHSLWIHEPKFRADQWMLYHLHSPKADNSRALIHGTLWTQDGVLVMSTAQEGLLKLRA